MTTGASWTRAEIERLHDMAEDGMSMREAAEALGKTYKSAQNKAIRKEIDFRNKQVKKPRKPPDEQLRERWLKLLPEMKEALRRDLEMNAR